LFGEPTFTWTATTDAGSGLAEDQLWVDGTLTVDNILASATSVTPTVALTDGAHSWRIYAVTVAGAVRHSHGTWWITLDTTPLAPHAAIRRPPTSPRSRPCASRADRGR